MVESAILTEALRERYVLERELGRGGMATVWLAEDVRHGRRVAIKLLHPELAAVLGADRFLAEIRLTANLQHPHILPLFDSGAAGHQLFYVMPYVGGETLRSKLAREKQLPVDEAVRLTREVASALDHAHRHGIIHRDIKPENILLQEEQALVADFGIALAVSRAGGSRVTETGLSLGTPQYMSPEQATADRELTPRSDVYALGAVLYEMLTGDPPHTGSSAQAIIAKVVTEVPRPLRPQRAMVPAHVEQAVLRALQKIPADRFATAGEFAVALVDPASVSTGHTAVVPAPQVIGTSRLRGWLLPASVFLATVAVGLWGWLRPVPTPSVGLLRAAILPPEGRTLGVGRSIALSPDGKRLAFVVDGASSRLWIQSLADAVAHEMPGTEEALLPFWSPDSRAVAFYARGKLRVIGAAGGAVQELASTPSIFGGTWGRSGEILISAVPDAHLLRVPVRGGQPVRWTPKDSAARVLEPSFLPDDRRFVFSHGNWGGVFLGDLATGEVRRLRESGGDAVFIAPDHLMFTVAEMGSPASILRQRLDPRSLELVGPVQTLIEGVHYPNGFANFTLSASDMLVYQAWPRASTWVRTNRRGEPLDTIPTNASWMVRVSPDGRRLAQGGTDLWVWDAVRKVSGKVVGLPFVQLAPVWSPDGRRLGYWTRAVPSMIAQLRQVDVESGRDEMLLERFNLEFPTDWAPDGRTILFDARRDSAASLYAIWALDLITKDARIWLSSGANVSGGRFSPDGRWVAYVSDETGQSEVYVRAFAGASAGVRVSPGGGGRPAWRADGRQLFYTDASGTLVVVPIMPGSIADVGAPRPWMEGSARLRADESVQEVTRDGEQVIVQRRPPDPPLSLVAGWSKLLESEPLR